MCVNKRERVKPKTRLAQRGHIKIAIVITVVDFIRFSLYNNNNKRSK